MIAQKGAGELFPGVPNIKLDERELGQSDALLNEIRSFIDSIRNGTPPAVSGRAGRMALETALKINESLKGNFA
jgi:predicted dehydrogenase